MFDQGHLKFVILRLLDEKPRHGYEIIKEIEDRFGGSYSPSPGTVYPTLTMLEDLGYARVTPEEGGKKIYEITDEGRAHLAENQPLIDDIFSKIEEFAQSIFGEPMMEVNRGLKNVAAAVYGSKRTGRNAEQMKKIREILDRAAAEIDGV
jgi:DNA-binding PadR family transcriptional regulator